MIIPFGWSNVISDISIVFDNSLNNAKFALTPFAEKKILSPVL